MSTCYASPLVSSPLSIYCTCVLFSFHVCMYVYMYVAVFVLKGEVTALMTVYDMLVIYAQATGMM